MSMTHVPEQVRQQSEAIRKLYEEMGGDDDDTVIPPVLSAPAPAPAPAPAVTDDWKQKYENLLSMYNTEVPSLIADKNALVTRLGSLEQLVATMAQPAAPSPASAPAAKVALVTDADRAEYGESIEVMRRVHGEEIADVRAYYENELTAIRKQIEGLTGSMATVTPKVNSIVQQQARSAEQVFWADISEKVPNWQEINNNPRFHEWLLTQDPRTGLVYQTYLEDAQRNLDATRVAAIFTDWPGNASQQRKVDDKDVKNKELEEQIAPGRSKAGKTGQEDIPVVYSRADIAKFYNDVRSGVYKGRDAERIKVEQDIFLAQTTGRVV